MGMLGLKNQRSIVHSFQNLFSYFLQSKKKRPSRRALADSELVGEDMDVDKPVVPLVRDLNANFVDDDELQTALARSRQAKLRKAKKLSPEELAKKSECSANP